MPAAVVCLGGFFAEPPCPGVLPLQVRELVDDVVWEEHCIGHAADADLDIKVGKAVDWLCNAWGVAGCSC